MHLDRFYKKPKDHQGDTDDPAALDHVRILKTLKVEIQQEQCAIIVVEGYRAFYDADLLALMHIKFWIDIPKALCKMRKSRNKNVTDAKFEKIWSWHLAYQKHVQSHGTDLKHIDGDQTQAAMHLDALGHIKEVHV